MRTRHTRGRPPLPLVLLALCVGATPACDQAAPADRGDPPPPTTASTPAQAAASTPASAAPPSTAPATAAIPDVRLIKAFPRLTFQRPVYITSAEDGTDRLFVLEQPGRIRTFPNDRTVDRSKIFLDIRERVFDRHNEEGLLSLAFHPEYAENGHFYVYYSAKEPRRGVVSRFSVSADDPNVADPRSEEVILEVEQPWGNHNGSTVLFGPDGYLYISLGDGGSASDPHENGQNLSTLLGTILRIDVDRTENGLPYAIPPDNPFLDRAGARGEIWAYGLRNAWRFSFDRATGDLWAGDVGQNRWEEIDLIVRGGNYGWRIREGFHPFAEGSASDPLLDPVVEHNRKEAWSITGGYVYRGPSLPALRGAYVYADYVTRRMWAFRYENGRVVNHREILNADPRPYISSFGETKDGELLICVFRRLNGTRGGKGDIYKLVIDE